MLPPLLAAHHLVACCYLILGGYAGVRDSRDLGDSPYCALAFRFLVGKQSGGALAIGALAIRALAIKRGRIERLNIGELEVDRLHVRELVVEQEQTPRRDASVSTS